MVSYAYDAWGRQVSMTDSTDYLGEMNPLRYRGYIYDEETGPYYLQSRYYDPVTGRFINADDSMYPVGTAGFNLFEYCVNNPTTLSDPSGKWFGWDDIFTGPVDEIIVLGGLSILGMIGVEWAQDAVDGIGKGLSDLWDGITQGLSNVGDIVFAKKSKTSGKDRATDKPSWVNKDMVDFDLPAQENARRIMNDKYGPGNWKPGPGGDFSKIVKWCHRNLDLKSLVPDDYENMWVMDGDLYISNGIADGFGWINGVFVQYIC